MDQILKRAIDIFRNERDLGNLKDDDLFESFCAFCILHSIYEDDFDPEDYRIGGGQDLGVDAAAIIVNGDLTGDDLESVIQESRTANAHFVIVQAKRSSEFDGKVITDLADNLMNLFDLGETGYPSSPEIKQLKKNIELVYGDIRKLRENPKLSVFYASSGHVTGDQHLEMKRQSAISRLRDKDLFREVDFNIIGTRDLRELYRRATTAVSVNFTMDKRIPLPKIPGIGEAYLGLLPASTLVSIITDKGGSIRKSLFFDNIRDFQDYNEVNAEIRKTIVDPDHQKRFAVLNNGVTIVAREIRPTAEEMMISDFQVVNGCQTCHVLFDEQDNIGDSVWVPIKIINSQDDDVIASITAATNRQTAVTSEDLEAKEKFHKDLEELFQSFDSSRKLYYERRSGQYAPREDIIKTRILNRSQLTRAFASIFLNEAARAGRAYKTLRKDRNEELFRSDHSTFAYYASAAVSHRIDWIFRNRKIARKYGPAKYHLMWAFKVMVLGDGRLPASTRKADKLCQKLADAAWDQDRSIAIVNSAIETVEKTIGEHRRENELERDFMRSKLFSSSLATELESKFESYSTNN